MQGCSSWRISAGSFGTSRKTGYKIFGRYQECGIQGLTDRSRRPCRDANQLAFQVEHFILNVKREHVSWGARKVGERLLPILRNPIPGIIGSRQEGREKHLLRRLGLSGVMVSGVVVSGVVVDYVILKVVCKRQ